MRVSVYLLYWYKVSHLAASTETVLSFLAVLVQKDNTDANFVQITRIASDTVLRSAYADVC
jgi:hypothetical protein